MTVMDNRSLATDDKCCNGAKNECDMYDIVPREREREVSKRLIDKERGTSDYSTYYCRHEEVRWGREMNYSFGSSSSITLTSWFWGRVCLCGWLNWLESSKWLLIVINCSSHPLAYASSCHWGPVQRGGRPQVGKLFVLRHTLYGQYLTNSLLGGTNGSEGRTGQRSFKDETRFQGQCLLSFNSRCTPIDNPHDSYTHESGCSEGDVFPNERR